MAIKVGDRIEFQTPDMLHAETSIVEKILHTQDGSQYYVQVPSLGHYRAIYKDDITFYHPTNKL